MLIENFLFVCLSVPANLWVYHSLLNCEYLSVQLEATVMVSNVFYCGKEI